ncbi:16S rRNA (cytosine(967)-C(5))-methyltransferase RsmB [Pseudomonadota bacterium]
MDVRTAAAKALDDVIRHGRSLSSVLPQWQARVQPKDQALLQELCYGVCRWHPRLDALVGKLLQKKLKPKDTDVRCLMLLGLYQLIYMRVPDHAAVSATVAVTGKLKKPWAKGLVNAVLRNAQRQQESLMQEVDANPVGQWAHPEWLVSRLQGAYPDQWQQILDANNQHPPMCLRVNHDKTTRSDYLRKLTDAGVDATETPCSEDGLMLAKAIDVESLPSFKDGHVSVQDSAAQLAAELLAAEEGDYVLDACAAPGGKTAHVLERQPGLAGMVALDIDAGRLERVKENFKRLQLKADIVVGDAAAPDSWWSGKQFDRIMLDAPCSASGVIRRHPDIKLLRRDTDIEQLSELQNLILKALWPLLKPGGMLLYVTCSVLPQENVKQLQRFCAEQGGATESPIRTEWGVKQAIGRQILPGQNGMDGFYYARLIKEALE